MPSMIHLPSGRRSNNTVKALRPNLPTEIVNRADQTSEFKVPPKRWIVERTFADCGASLARDIARGRSLTAVK